MDYSPMNEGYREFRPPGVLKFSKVLKTTKGINQLKE